MSPFDASPDAKKDRQEKQDAFRAKHADQINGSDSDK